jgi:hypothetical protein
VVLHQIPHGSLGVKENPKKISLIEPLDKKIIAFEVVEFFGQHNFLCR